MGTVNLDILVAVPRLSVTEINLHHPHPAFHQTASHQTAAAETDFTIFWPKSFFFRPDVKHVRRFGLHPESHFHGLDARLELGITAGLVQTHPVQLIYEIDLMTLSARVQVLVVNKLNQLLRLCFGGCDVTALVNRREKSRTPELRTDDREARTQHDKRGKVLILRA